jgi:hypothetical protein
MGNHQADETRATRPAVTALLALALLACGSRVWAAAEDAADGAGADQVELRLRLRKGQSFPVRTSVEQHVTQEAGGAKQQMSQNMGFGYVIRVEGVDDQGNATVRMEYQSVRLSMKGADKRMNMEYDSDDPPEVPEAPEAPEAAEDADATNDGQTVGRGLGAVVGQSFTMTLTPAGKVTGVAGLKAVADAVLKNTQLPAGPTGAAIKKAVAEQFSEAAIREQTENMLAFYPDRPVAVGDSWTRKTKADRGLAVITNTTYTLTGREDGLATIELKAKVSANPGAKPTDAGLAKIVYELAGTATGSMNVDEATGWARSSHLKQDLAGTMNVQILGRDPIAVPTTMTSVLTVEPGEEKSADVEGAGERGGDDPAPAEPQ